jgi:hypothetical protein
MRIPARFHAALATAALLPVPAAAHVKWFAPYDVTQPPLPLDGVFGAHFLLVFAGFLLLVCGGYVLDRSVCRTGAWAGWLAAPLGEALEERLMRAGIGAFFTALFATGGVILTPELRTAAEWPAWLQGAIALSMLSLRRSRIRRLPFDRLPDLPRHRGLSGAHLARAVSGRVEAPDQPSCPEQCRSGGMCCPSG